jgi:hypothetical protein
MIRTPIRLIVLLAASFTAIALAAPAQAATPYCGITWGSLAKQGSSAGGADITNVRAGRHDCYDRLVIDLNGSPQPGSWSVQYVDQVRQDPSDQPVPLRGGAFLRIVAHAPEVTPDGVPTYAPANRSELVDVTGFRTFRQVADAGSSEGVSSFGLGVRARLPFRVFTLSGPGSSSRIVVDVAHLWQQ